MYVMHNCTKHACNVDDVDVPEGLPISNDYEFLIIEEHLEDVTIKNQSVSVKLIFLY